MKEFIVRHSLSCKECKADFTQPHSIDVHFVVCDEQFDRASSVNRLGILQDVEEDLVKKGFHAGSFCHSCDKQLDEEFVMTEEVENLLAGMRSRVNEKQCLTSVQVKELLTKAADTIVLLSRENSEISAKLKDIENIIEDTASAHPSSLLPSMDEINHVINPPPPDKGDAV